MMKMCSCIKVRPRSSSSTGPRTVSTLATVLSSLVMAALRSFRGGVGGRTEHRVGRHLASGVGALAALDRHLRTRDKGRLLGYQEHDQRRDILDRAETAERRYVDIHAPERLGRGRGHRRLN